jgi:hypothetical protein
MSLNRKSLPAAQPPEPLLLVDSLRSSGMTSHQAVPDRPIPPALARLGYPVRTRGSAKRRDQYNARREGIGGAGRDSQKPENPHEGGFLR